MAGGDVHEETFIEKKKEVLNFVRSKKKREEQRNARLSKSQ